MEYFGHCLGIFRELGLPLKEAKTLTSIGTVLAAHGDLSGAEAAWRQAWAIFSGLGVPEANRVEAWLQP